MALLEVIGLEQRFDGGYRLGPLDLAVDRGEVLAVIGPTGAGKTTLLRLLDLLDRPAAGRIVFDGRDVTSSGSARLRARRRMAYVQQRPVMFARSVFDNVAMGLRWRGVPRRLARGMVEAALRRVGMEEHRRRDARTLSGGEVQRVALARALVTEPELLILDEPTANLDPVSTERIEEVLAGVIRDGGTAVILSTHDRDQAQRLATRMAVLIDGEVLQTGTPQEIFRSPARKRVADFVGVGNMIPAVVAERLDEGLAVLKVNGASIQAVSDLPVGSPVWAVVRTEDVTFSQEETHTSARNLFKGPIVRMVPVGTLVRLELDCGFPLVGVVTARTVEEMGLGVGVDLYASFKATAVHVLARRR